MTLPEAIRRAYIEKVKDSPHLSPLPTRYWEPEKPVPRASEIEEALRLEAEGISLSVDVWNKEQEELRAYWKIIQRRTPLMVAAGRGDVANHRSAGRPAVGSTLGTAFPVSRSFASASTITRPGTCLPSLLWMSVLVRPSVAANNSFSNLATSVVSLK